MSYSRNHVQLIGHLGGDPITGSSTSVSTTRISVATNRYTRNADTGELNTVTDWHRVVLFNQAADFANRFLKKGAYVFVEGRLQSRRYIDNNGIERVITEILSNSISSLGNKNDSTNQDDQQNATQKTEHPMDKKDSIDEDIPF